MHPAYKWLDVEYTQHSCQDWVWSYATYLEQHTSTAER